MELPVRILVLGPDRLSFIAAMGGGELTIAKMECGATYEPPADKKLHQVSHGNGIIFVDCPVECCDLFDLAVYVFNVHDPLLRHQITEVRRLHWFVQNKTDIAEMYVVACGIEKAVDVKDIRPQVEAAFAGAHNPCGRHRIEIYCMSLNQILFAHFVKAGGKRRIPARLARSLMTIAKEHNCVPPKVSAGDPLSLCNFAAAKLADTFDDRCGDWDNFRGKLIYENRRRLQIDMILRRGTITPRGRLPGGKLRLSTHKQRIIVETAVMMDYHIDEVIDLVIALLRLHSGGEAAEMVKHIPAEVIREVARRSATAPARRDDLLALQISLIDHVPAEGFITIMASSYVWNVIDPDVQSSTKQLLLDSSYEPMVRAAMMNYAELSLQANYDLVVSTFRMWGRADLAESFKVRMQDGQWRRPSLRRPIVMRMLGRDLFRPLAGIAADASIDSPADKPANSPADTGLPIGEVSPPDDPLMGDVRRIVEMLTEAGLSVTQITDIDGKIVMGTVEE